MPINPTSSSAPRVQPSQQPLAPARSEPAAQPQPQQQAAAREQVYSVKPGDTFSGIARQHGLSVDALRDANPQVQDINRIHPGQQLALPTDTFDAPPAQQGGAPALLAPTSTQAPASAAGQPAPLGDFVEGLYQRLLGRPSDPEGQQSWVNYGNHLLNQGSTRPEVEQTLTAMMMQSDEYQRRVASGAVPPSEAGPPPAGPVGGPGPVAPVQDRPYTPQINPDKVGVVLNHNPENLPSAAILKEAGVTGVRVTLSASNFDPNNPANAQLWQERMRDWHQNGIHVTANLPAELVHGFPRPAWQGQSEGRGGPVGPQSAEWQAQFNNYKQGYLDRVGHVARELGQYVNAYEVWNEPDEPNNRDTYYPGLPAATFGQVLKDSYTAIKANDRSGEATVMTGGLDSGNPNYLREAAAATGNRLYADGVGLHPYAKDPTLPQSNPGSLAHIVNDYSRMFGLPIYITEASSPDRSRHAQFVSDFARSADQMPAVARSYFFWSETYDGHPGLMSPTTGPTEAHGALARLLGMKE